VYESASTSKTQFPKVNCKINCGTGRSARRRGIKADQVRPIFHLTRRVSEICRKLFASA